MKGIRSSHLVVLCKIFEKCQQSSSKSVSKEFILTYFQNLSPERKEILDLDLLPNSFSTIIRYLKDHGYITSSLTHSTPPSAILVVTKTGVKFLREHANNFQQIIDFL